MGAAERGVWKNSADARKCRDKDGDGEVEKQVGTAGAREYSFHHKKRLGRDEI